MNMMESLFAALLDGSAGEQSVPSADTDAVIHPEANGYYLYGTLHSLQVSEAAPDLSYTIVFTSGSTATDCSFPDNIRWPKPSAAPPAIEANTQYEINIEKGRALWSSWAADGE